MTMNAQSLGGTTISLDLARRGLGAAEVAIGVESVGQQVGVTLGQRGAADDEHAAPERGEDEAEEDIGASALLDELLRRKRRVWESWSASRGGIG